MNNQQLISQLIAARDSLTPDNWRKGGFFKIDFKNPNICMCAHGALQVQVNPICRKAYEKNKALLSAAPIRQTVVAASLEDVPEIVKTKHRSLQQIWNNRPVYLKQDYIRGSQNYGKREAHFLLEMVGLTIGFNDDPKTTLEMVKAKFDEAIELAKTLD